MSFCRWWYIPTCCITWSHLVLSSFYQFHTRNIFQLQNIICDCLLFESYGITVLNLYATMILGTNMKLTLTWPLAKFEYQKLSILWSFTFINIKISMSKILWRDKNAFLIRKLIKSWFDEIFFTSEGLSWCMM